MKPFEWHGKRFHYIGADADGVNYWLQEAKFDCGWYWGLGYVETFTNNRNPSLSKDIGSHSHFNYMMDDAGDNWFDAFKVLFTANRLDDSQIWKLVELMKSAYTARKYADMLHIGGAHYTRNPIKETIQADMSEYDRINEKIIPEIMEKVYCILDGRSEEDGERKDVQERQKDNQPG